MAPKKILGGSKFESGKEQKPDQVGLASFVYDQTYDVIQINNDRIVVGKAVMAQLTKRPLR